jgi:hypothetical protein
VNGYWQNGTFVRGQTVRTAGTGGVGKLELEVAAAVARARDNGSALKELGDLLTQHPVLKVDTSEQVWNPRTGSWEGTQHLLTPLAALFAEQLLKPQTN